jgi:hypothetical protein
MVDGQWCGIELTERVHEPTLKRSIKAHRERRDGKEPKKPEAYFVWEQASLLLRSKASLTTRIRTRRV